MAQTELTIKETVALLKALYVHNPAGVSVLIEGQPGVGKSDAVRQAARELGIAYKEFRPALLDPTDIRGLIMPDIEHRTAVWFPPTFLPNKDDGEKGISFADEVTSAPPATQGALYQYFLDRGVGEHRLGNGWMTVAAGNSLSDRAIVYRMSSALANRFLWVHVRVDVDSWLEWAAHQTGFNYEYIGWIKAHPDMLSRFEQDKDVGRAFPTPRSVAKAAGLPTTIGDELYRAAVVGCVGEAAAASFFTYRKFFDQMPATEPVLTGKAKTVPKSRDVACAFVVALVAKSEKKHWPNLIAYAKLLEADIGMFLMTLLRHKCGKELQQVPGFLEWFTANGGILAD